ncbi:RNA-binding protein [Enterococcus ureilyticus]|uniref:RNA-binding protein n=1 Tax=Enterococcus ureilyticus TaxID=1131292 RepID=A0A1E5H9B1_9ENTE|nr:DUF3850 domain-containing protein [Enterococcus ureilyticus]MBM7688432.1 ASC-1-like (ASCH) protein [Enterococcus ureilyticus]OEG21533.1 RNA-binding protein [Enterococcus ureilyticus]
MVHELKIDREYFIAVLEDLKKFEIRFNDRDFKVGDIVILKEIDKVNRKPTGRQIKTKITYITNYEQKNNYVVFGIEKV